MKKILYLFTTILLILSSCSNDDNSSTNENRFLLKKTIKTDNEGLITTTIYTYNENKIVSQVSNLKEGIYYTYTGDLITKMEYRLYDGTIEQQDVFTYDNNKKLIEFLSTQPGNEIWDHKEKYVYNIDGSVSVYEEGVKTSIINFSDGEVTEIISTNSSDFKYAYDTKNNPFKDVLGFDKIAFVYGEADGILHNKISEVSTYGNVVKTRSSKITYNAAGYPEKSFDNFEDNGTSTEYFY